jgi:hypothetical protein
VENIAFIADSVNYYIADPDSWVFKTLQKCLVTWTIKYQSSTQLTQRK